MSVSQNPPLDAKAQEESVITTHGLRSPSANLFERLGDFINPIVLKELRQAVHGRFVSGLLMVLLAIQLLAVWIYAATNPQLASRFDSGPGLFMTLQSLLLGISLLLIPSYTGIRLISERTPATMDLLFITTISPRAIIAGKSLAAIILTLLIFSACMPFMVLTYLLRGIDLPSMFIVLAVSFFLVVIAIEMTIFVALIPASRPMHLFLGLIEFIILFFLFTGMMGGSQFLLLSGVGARLGDWSFWGPALSFLTLGLILIGIFFVLSVALIAPVSANRALPVRGFMITAWLLSGAVCLLGARSTPTYSSAPFGHSPAPFFPFLPITDALPVWGYSALGLFAIALLLATSERETLGHRVALKIPRTKWRRWPAFFLFSGAANGLLWSLLMIALTLAVLSFYGVLSGLQRGLSSANLGVMVVFTLYILAYTMTALFLRRRFLSRRVTVSQTWVVALLLIAGGCLIPFSVRYFFGPDTSDPLDRLWFLGNPFEVQADSYLRAHTMVAVIWAAVASSVNASWFIRQVRAFHPGGNKK